MNVTDLFNALKPAVPAILALTEKLLPVAAGNAGMIGEIAQIVIAATPVVVQEYRDLAPIVARIITTLKSDPTANQAAIDDLIAAEDILDAEFDDVLAKARAADQAALASKT